MSGLSATGTGTTTVLPTLGETYSPGITVTDGFSLTTTAGFPAPTAGLALTGSGLTLGGTSPIDPSLVLSLDFANSIYWWNGSTSLSTAITCVRVDSQISTAQNADGTWSGYDSNVPRVPVGVGLLIELQASNYCKWNRDFLNAVWSRTNMSVSDAGDNPIVGTQPIVVEVLPAGTTSWSVPGGVSNLIFVGALGPGGNGAAGVVNTAAGGGGGGGAWARRSNVAVTAGTSLTVQVGAGGSGLATFLKDSGGTTQVSAAAGGSASGSTAGSGGAAGSSIGSTVRSGGNGGAGSSGTGSRGGGGGGGAANDSGVGGSNSNGRTGSGGNNSGGGGGGPLGGGVTASTAAAAGVGGVGGTNLTNTGGGTGGTVTVAAGSGASGGGGGGGLSAVGINGGAGSSSTWTYTSGTFSQSFTGAGGGGGGGGLAGIGGGGGLGAGGGGGGSTAALQGAGGTGGDGELIIVYGGANAARLTATAANATLTQNITAAAATKTPYILIRPRVVTGPILLSQDNGVSATDIRSQFVAGRYQQAFAPNQAVLNPVWRLEIVNAGDSVDVDLAGLEDNEFCTSPIPTTSGLAIRHADLCTLNLGSFPTFVTSNDLTVLTTVKPCRYGISTTGTETFGGWSWFDMDGFSPSVGSIDISGITGTTMTVTDTHGINLVAHTGLSGGGVTADTVITAQISGTAGGAGDYRVSIIQTVGAGSVNVLIQNGYIGNAVKKPLPTLRQNIGLTVMGTGLSYGFDPQTAQYQYFQWNRCGFTTRATDQAGIVALSGNLEFSTPRGSWCDPQYINNFLIAAQRYPRGANPVVGPVANLVIYTKYDASGASIGEWTARPYP